MTAEALLRAAVLAGAGAVIVAFVIGGILSRVVGLWSDGERRIALWQLGPFVTGSCDRLGGTEHYIGWSSFSRVRLWRRASGGQLLEAMGFEQRAERALRGQIMGDFRFVLDGRALRGTFVGRRFRLSSGNERVISVQRIAPVDCCWERQV